MTSAVGRESKKRVGGYEMRRKYDGIYRQIFERGSRYSVTSFVEVMVVGGRRRRDSILGDWWLVHVGVVLPQHSTFTDNLPSWLELKTASRPNSSDRVGSIDATLLSLIALSPNPSRTILRARVVHLANLLGHF